MRSLLTEIKPVLHITYESIYKIKSAQNVFRSFRYTRENIFPLL